jgi:serine protease Do
MSSSAGSGSGFIISADGLAVTNNHVVTGAATLEVFIGGDTTKGYNADVVGVSECNDLAVIDIDAPGDLPRFDWYDGEVKAGLDVYAAGFPLGDPEFTLTKGIVAKAKAVATSPGRRRSTTPSSTTPTSSRATPAGRCSRPTARWPA